MAHVRWTEEEKNALAQYVAKQPRTIGVISALRDAQESVLSSDRHRKILSLAQVPWLEEFLNSHSTSSVKSISTEDLTEELVSRFENLEDAAKAIGKEYEIQRSSKNKEHRDVTDTADTADVTDNTTTATDTSVEVTSTTPDSPNANTQGGE